VGGPVVFTFTLSSSGQSSLITERRCLVLPVRYELNLNMSCRKKKTASVL
jgi:hypothetical protein